MKNENIEIISTHKGWSSCGAPCLMVTKDLLKKAGIEKTWKTMSKRQLRRALKEAGGHTRRIDWELTNQYGTVVPARSWVIE